MTRKTVKRRRARLLFAGAVFALLGSAQARAAERDADSLVLLNSGTIDTRLPAAFALRAAPAESGGRRLHLVQLAGPVTPQAHEAIAATGAAIVSYVPRNAYLVYGDGASITRVKALASGSLFRWDAPYTAALKISREARTSASDGSSALYAIQLVRDDAVNAATLGLIDQLRSAPVVSRFDVLSYVNVIAPLPAAALKTVAERPDVVSIQRYVSPVKLDERQDQILAGNLAGGLPTGPGYLAWLAGKGFTQSQFTTSGLVVDVSDSGIDNATTAPGHFALYVAGTIPGTSRVAYSRLVGTPTAGSTRQGCDGHGNLNAHLIGGFDDSAPGAPFTDASGYHFGLGVCPFVKLGSSVIFDPTSFTSPVPSAIQSNAYSDGARISSNSWGFPGAGVYDVYAQAYDALVRDAQPTGSAFPAAGNQEMVLVFAAGNEGPSAGIATPGSAKNVITVGAAESVRPLGGADVCGVDDPLADDADDMAPTSSRGPTADGRRKPDLVAPGTHVSGGVPQAAVPGPTGTALACYAANTPATFGICGGVAPLPGALYTPSGQQFYTASSGTSVAAAAVSGGAALLRQHFLNNALPAPSPAMTKALLLNATRYLNGTGANDALWSNAQGMGEMDLSQLFDRAGGTATILRDELPADLFTATGQSRTITGTVANPAKPLRVTLAWTDAPGSTSGAAYDNDLDLTVTAGGLTYTGNVFSGAASVPGGSADGRNNVESVFLPAGITGDFSVTVTAANVNSDGVPGGGPLDQDYALVAYNGTATTAPVITGAGSSFVTESCPAANGVLDPGETVTLQFFLKNTGTAATSNLVATLLPTGGVSSPGGPQTYGVLTPGGPAVSGPFVFTVSAGCGSTLTATFQLDDDGTPLGTVPFTFRIGTLATQAASYAGPAVAIPDGNPTGVDVPLVVSGFAGTLADLDFSFDGTSCDATAGSTTVGLDHTFVGDLTVSLRSPLGTTVTLLNRPGGGVSGSGGNNFCQTVLDDQSAGTPIQSIANGAAPYTGSFTPASALAAFNGEDPNGTWTLTVKDAVSGDTGNVRAFSLLLSRYACCTGSCITPSPVAGSNSPIHVAQTLALTASTVAGATYSWTGPNGFTSSAQNPTIPGVTLAAAGTYSVVAIVASCPSPPATTNVSVLPFGATAMRFFPITPCRIVDTRNAAGPYGSPALAAATPRTFVLGGQCGIPTDAQALSLNVTIVSPTGAGQAVLYPAGLPKPTTSTISFKAGAVRANNVQMGVGGDPGALTVVAEIPAPGSTHFIIDANGYFK